MVVAERVIASHFALADGELVLGGVRARELVERFGSPLYVFDARSLAKRLTRVQSALGPRVSTLFALKANPSLAVAASLRALGAGAEVASAGELLVAIEAGFATRDGNTQFAGPGKHGRDLTLAVAHGVTLNVESTEELQAIEACAAEVGARARVALRVNPPASKTGSRMRMSGGSAKFGVDEAQLERVAQLARGCAHVDLVGLHTYGGTQTFDHEGWCANARYLLNTAIDLERVLGEPLETLNFGGGFGVALSPKDPIFDLDAAAAGLGAIIAEDPVPTRRYFVELGRYLVAESGVFLSRALYTKRSGDKRHVILDAGMHNHAAAAGVGTVIRRPFPMVNACNVRSEPAHGVQLGGPLCTPADSFPTSESIGKVAQGDIIAFLCSGAYGLSFSPTMFLSHGTPAEVWVEDGRASLVRERGRPEDALRGQRLPSASP